MRNMIRKATIEDATEIQSLILLYAEQGQMLARTLDEIRRNIGEFWVAERQGHIVGLCSLKTGWEPLLEIRSLAVHPAHYRQGIGSALVRACIEEALAPGNETLFVFTYAVDLFTRLGFNVVDKQSLPVKVYNDCEGCLHKDNCDETAMTLSLKSLKKDGFGNMPLNPQSEVLY